MVVAHTDTLLVTLALPRKLPVASLLELPKMLALALAHCVPLREVRALELREALAQDELEGLLVALLVVLELIE